MISFNNIGNLGRLANQMFQYASLKGVARNRGYDFSIPPQQVFGQHDPLVRTSELNIYNVFENIKNNWNNKEYPSHVELRLGNYCNLKCIMCGPSASSSILA